MNQQGMSEVLEGRRMLSATVVDNVLYVNGTTGNDAITVAQKSDLSVVVTDNGKATKFAPYSFHTISVDTGRGNDKVTLDEVVLPFGGSVYTHGGNDTVVLDDVNISADFTVDTGDNDDVVATVDGWINGGTFNTGNGNDTVFGYGNTLLEYGAVLTGAGNDAVILAKTVAYGFTSIDLGSGFDIYVGFKNNFPTGKVQTLNAELKIVI